MSQTLFVAILDEPNDPPPRLIGVFPSMFDAQAECARDWRDLLDPDDGLNPVLSWDEKRFFGVRKDTIVADPQDGETMYIIYKVEEVEL